MRGAIGVEEGIVAETERLRVAVRGRNSAGFVGLVMVGEAVKVSQRTLDVLFEGRGPTSFILLGRHEGDLAAIRRGCQRRQAIGGIGFALSTQTQMLPIRSLVPIDRFLEQGSVILRSRRHFD